MALRIPWDKYEAIILLEAWLQVRTGTPKLQMVNLVSYQLRLKAVNQGLEIDDIFRNTNGISFQMTSMATAYEKIDMGKPASKLFTEIVDLYLTDPSAYQNLKEEAMKMVDYLSETKDDFARYVYAAEPRLATKILESIGFIENFAISTKASSHSIFEDLTEETITILRKKVLSHKFFIVKYKKYLSFAELGLKLLSDYVIEMSDNKTSMLKNDETEDTIIIKKDIHKENNGLISCMLHGTGLSSATARSCKSDDLYAHTNNVPHYIRKDKENFYRWLLVQGVADNTAKQYVKAVRDSEKFAEEHGLSSTVLYTNDVDVARATVSALNASPEFKRYNNEKHHRFTAAMGKLLQYYGIDSDDIYIHSKTNVTSIKKAPDSSKTDFVEWMLQSAGLSSATARSYKSAINSCDYYAQTNGLYSGSIFDSTTYDVFF